MPNRVQWTTDYNVGNEILDNQHRKLLAQCNTLADYVSGTDPASDLKFREIFDELMALAHQHFATEEALLARYGYPLLDEHKDEQEEFDYLSADIITTENFEKVELQRFLVLWWVGHIMGSGKKYGVFLEQQPVP